jgi:predicted dehydrogenase
MKMNEIRIVVDGLGEDGMKAVSILKKLSTQRPRIKVYAYDSIKSKQAKTGLDYPPPKYDAIILTVPQESRFEQAKNELGEGTHVMVAHPMNTCDNIMELKELGATNKCACYLVYPNQDWEIQIKLFIDEITNG